MAIKIQDFNNLLLVLFFKCFCNPYFTLLTNLRHIHLMTYPDHVFF